MIYHIRIFTKYSIRYQQYRKILLTILGKEETYSYSSEKGKPYSLPIYPPPQLEVTLDLTLGVTTPKRRRHAVLDQPTVRRGTIALQQPNGAAMPPRGRLAAPPPAHSRSGGRGLRQRSQRFAEDGRSSLAALSLPPLRRSVPSLGGRGQ